jgi:STE24 endopeptidase
MNIFATIILAALLFDYSLNLLAKILNLKTLAAPLPDEFKDVYDPASYQKMQDYTRVNTRFSFVTATFNIVVILAFWFCGGFNWLDGLVRGLGFSLIPTGIAYIGLLTLGQSLLSLPFSIYDTFVIEARFGFNRTTIKTFILDLLKGLALALMLGGPLLAGILAFFHYAGVYAWLYAWLVTVLYSLVMQYIAPTWIMPLFNKFTPLEDGELKTAIVQYAEKVRFPLAGIFVMDGSKRSSKTNAFFTGFGKNKRIALFDTLIAKHTVAELVAVLAHEIGHYKKKHIQLGIFISIVHSAILFYLMSLFISRPGLFEAFYMEQVSIYAGLLFFVMLFSPLDIFLSPLMNLLSRRHEFQADQYCATTSGLIQDMINALRKLSRDNLSHLTPHPFYVFLHYSHPPVLQRIRRIRTIGEGSTS